MQDNTSRQLKMLGMILFLAGLVIGMAVMNFKNPRMGLSAHLEGVMNGTFLAVAGILWKDLRLSAAMLKTVKWTLIYGAFANFTFTLLSAALGTSKTTPIAGAGHSGTELHESIVTAGLVSVALTMVVALAGMAYGLRGKAND